MACCRTIESVRPPRGSWSLSFLCENAESHSTAYVALYHTDLLSPSNCLLTRCCCHRFGCLTNVHAVYDSLAAGHGDGYRLTSLLTLSRSALLGL